MRANYSKIVRPKLKIFFQKFADGGPRRKTEKFWQIEKIIGDLHELDNLKQKIFVEKKKFKIEIANVIFRKIFDESENIFLSIAQI